jgi:hypothetical protein
MTHPDHDQVIGRLVSARLRAGGIAAEPCPDAELLAAYVDGGLAAAEVEAVDRHLAGCGACRQLVGLLAGDDGVEAPAVVEPVGPAVVLPFRPRVTWAWMSLAAGILGAVTLWTVVRLDRAPESSLAERVAPAAPAAYPADRVGATGGATAPAAPAASAPKSSVPPAELAARQAVPTAAAAPHGKDLASADQRTAGDGASNPEAYLQSRLPLADAAKAIDAAKRRSDEAASGRAAGAIAAAEPVPAPSPPPMARPPAQQTNTAAAGLTRARGPLAQNAVQNQEQSQAFAQPQTSPVGQAAGQSAAPSAAAAPPPAPAPAVASTPTAAGERAARLAKAAPPVAPPSAPAPRPTEMRERDTRGGAARAERAAAAAAPAAGAPPAAEEEKADAFRSAPAGVPLARIALDASAPIAFAEPDGRLLWRIAGGNRIESSSDAGLTWARRHTARARLLAGSAPSIDVAWVVGERGLVLRRAVPGDWTAVSPPATVALIGVTATSATQARVVAADGRRFETTDGGQTWAPVEAADR